MRKVWVLAFGVLMLTLSMSVFAGEYLMNDTGGTVTSLRVVFSKPVTITGFGDTLLTVEPGGKSTTFVFSGGQVEAWSGHWMNWEPKSAVIKSFEWISGADASALPKAEATAEEKLAQLQTPDEYLYVPKITYTPEEKKCLDCKTFAIVAIMRYYGATVEFEDICREVGQPPGAVFEDVAFFQRLLSFVKSRGLVVQPHLWGVDNMVHSVQRGQPVIASHRIGEDMEPGIVKGYSESHIWVWGIWEMVMQRSADTLYERGQFDSLLGKRSTKGGMMGYVPYIWKSPLNCYVIYKPGAQPSPSPYAIDYVPYVTRQERSESGGPGVVEVMSLAGDGEMRWASPFVEGVDKRIDVIVFNDEYVQNPAHFPSVRFAIRFFPDSTEFGQVIIGYGVEEKSFWSNQYGYVFEEIQLPVTRVGNAWIGTVDIRPKLSMEGLYAMGPDSINTPFFGYTIRVEH